MGRNRSVPDSVRELFNGMPTEAIVSALMAAFLSALRILGDDHSKKWQRISLEIPTAGCIGYSIGIFILESGFGFGAALVASAIVGHLGTGYVRTLARRMIEKKTGVKNGS